MELMVIDDDRISNFINTRIAERSGLFQEIRSVSSGRDALTVFEQASDGTAKAPDMILLDLNMPVMGGFDFIEALRKIDFPTRDQVSIVIVTSSDDEQDMQRAQSLGIKHYLLKSLGPKDLQTTLFSLCNKSAVA